MKLISCYVEGFGAIKKQTIKFNGDITAICEENGYGKTTLATFLEAMFYGMTTDKKNSAGLPTRKHYLPFYGGKYGGNVEFEHGGDKYKIERGFDEKSEVRDTCTVYKNGGVCTDFGRDVGKKLLEIDQDAFRRLMFISPKEIEIKSDGSINEKLGAAFTSGGGNTDKALKILDEKATIYRKKKGGGGLIPQENNAILNLQQKKAELEAAKDRLPEQYRELAECEDKLNGLQSRLKQAQTAELTLKDWERYDSLVKSAEDCRKTLEAIDGRYPQGLPQADELKAASEAISAKATLERQTGNLLSDEDGGELERLDKKYAAGPSESEIAEAERGIGGISEINAQIRSAEDGAPSAREGELRARFKGGVPRKSELEAVTAALDEYRRLEKIYADTPDYTLEQAAPTRKAGGKKYTIAAIISAAVALAGIGAIFAMTIAGVIIIAVGVIGLAASGFLYLNNKTGAANAETIQRINPEKAAAERAKIGAETRIRQRLAPYGYAADTNIYYLVESFENDAAEYGKILENDQKTAERIADLRAKRQNLQNELNAFFAPYGPEGGSFGEMLSALRSELGRYNSLKETRARLLAQNQSAAEAIERHGAVIQNFCNKYGFDPSDIGERIAEIGDDASNRSHAEADLMTYGKRAEAFRTEKRLETRPEADADTQEIMDEINGLNRDRSAILKDINDNETKAEEIDGVAADIYQHEQTLKDYERNYGNLCRATALLKKADTQLKDKYIAPIKNNFVKYANLLEKTLGEKVTMTSDCQIRFERGGEDRSEKYLSDGQLSICAFCFRIALIDNMYKGEKPFLILDDPFVNLDEKHLAKVKLLLNELSKGVQIIYFTCHESRNV